MYIHGLTRRPRARGITKNFESNIGRAIEETSVPFGTRNLSASQKAKVVKYNWADVYGTEEMLSRDGSMYKNKILQKVQCHQPIL